MFAGAGESLDEMKLLEEQARRIAEEAKKDEPKQKSMAFVKYVYTSHKLYPLYQHVEVYLPRYFLSVCELIFKVLAFHYSLLTFSGVLKLLLKWRS